MIRRHEHAVLQQRQLPVGVPRRRHHLPAVERVASVDELGVADDADEGAVVGALLDQLVGDPGGNAVLVEPRREHLGPVVALPDELALLEVEPPLERRALR